MVLYRRGRSYVCKRRAKGYMVGDMDAIQTRHVLVSAAVLDDVLELARMAAERLPQDDPLTSALRGAVGQARADAIIEP